MTFKQLAFLTVFVATFYLMLREKSRVPKGQVSQEALSNSFKMLVALLCLLNPVVAGAILYYGWKRRLPMKARQANLISLWAFAGLLLVGMLAFALFALTM